MAISAGTTMGANGHDYFTSGNALPAGTELSTMQVTADAVITYKVYITADNTWLTHTSITVVAGDSFPGQFKELVVTSGTIRGFFN